MRRSVEKRLLALVAVIAASLPVTRARADETIKLGLSIPLSGAAAI